MRGPVEQQLVPARARVQPQRDLVAHRPAWQEHRGLEAQAAPPPAPPRPSVVGSSPRCSSPTTAEAIAARIPSVGRVCVSL